MRKSDDRRRQVLAFIQARVEADGRPPTLDEIATACGFASRSAAQKHVRALEDSGDLEVTRGRSRGARPKKSKPTPQGAQQLFEIAFGLVGWGCIVTKAVAKHKFAENSSYLNHLRMVYVSE